MYYKTIEVTNGTNRFLSLLLLLTFFFGFQVSIVKAQELPPAKIYISEEIRDTPIGEIAHININFTPETVSFETAGFELLLSYDTTMLSIISVTQGELLDSCQWVFFTYAQDTLADCGGTPCPKGMIRIVAHAGDLTNGSPLCNISTEGTLVNIAFQVTSDPSYECLLAPINFYWYDCTDNSVSSKLGDTTFISRDVYQGRYEYQEYEKMTKDTTFPTPFGAPSECTVANTTSQRGIDFISYGDRKSVV